MDTILIVVCATTEMLEGAPSDPEATKTSCECCSAEVWVSPEGVKLIKGGAAALCLNCAFKIKELGCIDAERAHRMMHSNN